MATDTWQESVLYLSEHYAELNNPMFRFILEQNHDPMSEQHLAILNFVDDLHNEADRFARLLSLLTHTESAATEALDALQNGDLTKSQAILRINPAVITLPGVGAFVIAVILTVQHEPTLALMAWEQEKPRTSSTQRKALSIRLKGLLKHITEPEDHRALQTLLAAIAEDETT